MSSPLFSPTSKQDQFIQKVFDPQYTFLGYGGAAGGGKTFVCLAILILFCKLYPKSRWCVIRKSLTEIKLNTLPSFWKVCPTNFVKVWNKSEFLVTFNNGSQIIFKGENIHEDPELQWMDGLEVNGFLLEQAEELSAKTYDKTKLRAGRHVIDPMPPIKILLTLNPSQMWTKKLIYEPYIKGELEPPYCYIPAHITDNPHLPQQYVDGLKHLDQITYKRFVEGDWSAFSVEMPFAYAYSPDKHDKRQQYNQAEVLHLSFDFNRNPISCVVIQHYDYVVRVIKSIKLPNSDIYKLCDVILGLYPNALYLVTGDATGRSSSALVQDNLNYYTVIKQKLGINDAQIKVPSVNPPPEENQVLVNSILQNYPVEIDPIEAESLKFDLTYVEMQADGKIKKGDRNDVTQQADLLDCFRYWLNQHMSWYLRVS